MRALGHLFRAVWQRRLRHPREWASLHQWDTHFRPERLFTQVHRPDRQHQTWSFVHSAIYQFRQYEVIVKNRLHGHILCTLLDIPHVFLPNSYYKNRAFIEHFMKRGQPTLLVAFLSMILNRFQRRSRN
ncbi:MAG: hypothetical protein F6K00_01695 [Leptolyngbya sp. SIOISBB]|nr:hypothetical protein [Leptolyngbya sp. SIOISBB]